MAELPPLTADEFKENLKIQLLELESLRSTFCKPGEVQVDSFILDDINMFLDGKKPDKPVMLDFTVNLMIEDMKFEICVTLGDRYPNKMPEIFVRNHKLDRMHHINLNRDWYQYVMDLARGEPCIFAAVSWLQDNARKYIKLKNDSDNKKKPDEKYVRYWIYSHHIYSKSKRREIIDLAAELDVTGFCLPGTPGVICVEGAESNVNDWWTYIKSMNWKRIVIKMIEEDTEKKGREFLRFDKLKEIGFQKSGYKFNHMNMGEFAKYLEQHGVNYAFKELFGVEGQNDTAK